MSAPEAAPGKGLAAVVPAAGLSSRLGRFKPLEELGGLSLLARAAALFREAGVTRIVAVAGHRAPEVLAEAGRLGLQAVVNPGYERGMFTSIRAGLAALPPGLDGVFVLPVDIPLVRPQTVRRLLARFPDSPAEVLIPCFRGEPGHPPLLRAGLLPRVLAHGGDHGLRGALAGCATERVAVPDAGILLDVDTPADRDAAADRLARRGYPGPDEALALMELYDAGERGLGHARGVARAALALGRAVAPALERAGKPLDFALLEAAALVHDIAKGQRRHEEAGGRLLEAEGFPEAAAIVAAHRDIDPAGLEFPAERELVYLADKLVRGSQVLGLERRFQEKLDQFAGDAEACAAIARRRGHARDMARLVETLAGQDLQAILERAGMRQDDGPEGLC